MAKKRKISGRKSQKSESEPLEYNYHLPVLLKESIDMLVWKQDGIYIDGTLGGGGHTAVILDRLQDGGKVLAFDKDPDAVRHCSEKFSDDIHRKLVIFNECYSRACSKEEFSGKISGLLLDLGVSSRQLDGSDRGISYRFDATLDMRFGTEGLSAKELLNSAEEVQIERILRLYGEEPFARVVARRIVEKRRASTLNTVFQLKEAVEQAVPIHLLNKSMARVFQAIRIAVNNELQTLESTLTNIVPMLEKGGRIVVISYHSLEDRIMKNFVKEQTATTRKAETPDEMIYSTTVAIEPIFNNLTKNPITPSPEELSKNPRSRSAKLRVIEKR